MLAYTDYPFAELGDTAGQKAPIRQVEVLYRLTWKYVVVKVEGIEESIKWGYLYTEPGRLGEVPNIDIAQVPYEDGTYGE